MRLLAESLTTFGDRMEPGDRFAIARRTDRLELPSLDAAVAQRAKPAPRRQDYGVAFVYLGGLAFIVGMAVAFLVASTWGRGWFLREAVQRMSRPSSSAS